MTVRNLSQPHDRLVRHVLSEPDLMADVMGNYIDAVVVSQIDLSTLRCESPIDVDENLVQGIGDLLFSASLKTGKPSAVFVFFEHQSKEDRLFIFRVLEYMVRAWRKYLDETGKTEFLPFPICILLYHGKKEWKAPLVLADLFEEIPGVDKDILKFPVQLIDISQIPIDQLKGHPANRALFEILQAASMGKLEERFEHAATQLVAVKNDKRTLGLLKVFSRYAMFLCRPPKIKEMLVRVLENFMDDTEARKMEKSWAAELINEGIEKGIIQGRMEGLVEGLSKGEAKGRWEGEAKGKVEGILTFLEARFGKVPKPVRSAVTACTDLYELNALIRLAATCASMDEFKQELSQI